MFHDIPPEILESMVYLEEIDAQDRRDGIPQNQRLRQIPSETGKLLAILALSAPKGELLEIGTSGGYSALWISLASRQRGDKLTTFEIQESKAIMARAIFDKARLMEFVTLVQDDARNQLSIIHNIAFCFLDAEKEIYQECYRMVVPNLVSGGYLIADNAISHEAELDSFLQEAHQDNRVDALRIPIGKGLLVCRKL